jgi:chromosome segregation ATPase
MAAKNDVWQETGGERRGHKHWEGKKMTAHLPYYGLVHDQSKDALQAVSKKRKAVDAEIRALRERYARELLQELRPLQEQKAKLEAEETTLRKEVEQNQRRCESLASPYGDGRDQV